MHKLILMGILIIVSGVNQASTALPVKDNSEFELTLSQNNYNRLLIKNDSIMDFAFPDGAMDLKRDEQDGSVYITLGSPNPFTLFITTESGRHYSLTVSGEESLGKIIELVPQESSRARVADTRTIIDKVKISTDSVPSSAVVSLITHMQRHESVEGFNVKHHYFSQAKQLGKGLSMTPKESWQSPVLSGEIIQLYNAGKEELALSQEWFAEAGVKAMKFSQAMIAPKEKAYLYRVKEINHG